uniref:Positive regulator of CheA protein activity (CheW) n=1 Tax=uncultured bacterium contig00038 TaxID=1181526 RepID=A0A806KFU6_9BACT|nr:positive regulator of CheA protein activity (CheW) [uncultured bacterium contig00038]
MDSTVIEERTAQSVVPSGQLVTFTLDGVEFGLDIAKVQEITQRSSITPVPGSPTFIIGVLNLRGQIIPVIDSRLRFHLAPTKPTSKTRIIIIELAGQSTGLQVDAVAEVVKLDDFALRETPPLVAGVRSDYLAGMVQAGNRLITLIDLDKILDSQEFGQKESIMQAAAASSQSMAMGLLEHSLATESEEIEGSLPFVTFGLGKESFGMNLEFVEEIVELPPVTKVPDAPDYVLGVICIRNQVLPLLNLYHMFEIELSKEERNANDNMVILLTIGHAKLGVVVDCIQEIISVRDKEILPAPQTLKEEEISRLEGIVMRSDRMVSILRVVEILSHEDQQKLAGIGHDLGIQEITASEVGSREEISIIVFKLGREVYALELQEVREIIMVGLVTPVPRAPAFIQGVLNLRGEIIPVIDLRMRFGLEPQEKTALSRIVVTPISGVFTGLIVDSVDEVRNVDRKLLEPPPGVTSVGANAYITQVARTSTGVIFILGLQLLLTDSEKRQINTFQGKK